MTLETEFTIPEEPQLDPAALRASALRQALRLVEFYRITAEELSGSLQHEAADDQAAPAAAPVKYRHPVSGDTWDGQGSHPEWLRRALLQEGYRVAELKVEPSDN